jgi:hypothetical protein
MKLSQEAIQRMISGRSGGGGGGSSFDPSALAGYATQAWTEENYISKTFFNELFVIHKKVTTVVMDGETEISRTVTTDSIFAPNEIPGTTTETDEETGYVTTVTTEISSIESKKGFWTNYFISALGLNSEGGGGGGVSSLSELSDVQLSSPSNGQALIYDSTIGKWRNGAAGMNVSELTTYLTSKILTIKNGSATLGTWNPTAAGIIDIASAVSGYLPLSGGTMTGILKVATGKGIEDATGNGLLVYHPTNWSGVSASQWGAGAADCQGVIRSNDSDLKHYRGGTSYNILDSYNSGISGSTITINGTSINPVSHIEVGTNDLTGLSGSFFFGGNDALQSVYDYVGFQAGNSLDKWQMVAIESLKWRQNDSGGTNSTNWTAWKTILDSNNSSIVDGHKVKLNDTSIEVPVAYNIPSPGSFTSGYWHKLGDYVTAGDSSNLVLEIYDGNGYNAQAEQNSILRVVIKDGWQSTRAADNSVGVTIERFGVWAADMQISIVATDHNAGAVWIYFPWQYAAGTYMVSGNYSTWTHNSGTTGDTTTTPATNQTMSTGGTHSYVYLDNAYTNSNVASATKLQTARLLWGNSFDGTADVNGDITITKTGTTPALMTVTNGTGTVRLAAYETNRGIWDASGSGWLIGTGPTSSNPNTFLMRGNVGIGKSSPSYKLDVDGTINCTSIRIGGYTITADTTNQGLRINSAGLYADTYISALGANSGGGGGGGVTLNEPLSSINNASLGSPSGTDMAIVWTGSAWGYKYVPDNGGGGGGSGTVTSIKITVPTGFSISPTSAITTSGTFAISFASGYSLPTTAKQSNWDTAYNNNHQHSNKSVLDGITSVMVTKWNNCVNANDVTTQLQNYAYISSGVIHIGDASMTPLTSHQSVDGTFWGRSWSNHNTVSGSIEAGNSGGYIGGFDHIDLNTHGSLYGYGGYIDFYYNGANSYTSRIIEKESGVLSINAPNVAGLLVGGYNGDYVQIGQIRIVYESSNNALRIENANNGGAANLYAMGGISALGMSGNADGTISGNLTPSTSDTYTLGSNSARWKTLYLGYSSSRTLEIKPTSYDISFNSSGSTQFTFNNDMEVGGDLYVNDHLGVGDTNTDYALYVYGTAYITGNISAASVTNRSDMRLKDFVENINLSVESIAAAPSFKYTFKGDSRLMAGTSAQYWRGVLSEVVFEDADTMLSLDYGVTALAGVISVARKVMTHEERIAALEAENERLRNEIETLKAA